MSARDDLLALLEEKCRTKGHEPERHVDAYRAEVLREAAAKQRGASPLGPVNLCNCGESLCDECDTHKLIDLIDPDTP